MTQLLGFYAFAIGGIVGSFLNVVIHRYPREESIVFPGSHCPHCNAAIRWFDNIPILSFVLLLGRCRFCGAGIAWRFAPRWVMRAGYGLAYLGQSAQGPNTGFTQPTSLIASTDGGLTPAVSLSNPFPSSLFSTGLLKPVGSSLGLATNLGQSVSAQYLDRPLPYSHQFSFGFQRELRGGWLVDASYSGNLTRRLPVSLGLNFIPASTLNSMPVASRSAVNPACSR